MTCMKVYSLFKDYVGEYVLSGGAIHREINGLPPADFDIFADQLDLNILRRFRFNKIGNEYPNFNVWETHYNNQKIQLIICGNIFDHLDTFDFSILTPYIYQDRFWFPGDSEYDIYNKKFRIHNLNAVRLKRYWKLLKMGYSPIRDENHAIFEEQRKTAYQNQSAFGWSFYKS